MTNLYEVLGVEADADDAAIKRAFREKARKCHPDSGGSTEEMAEVNHAWMVLRDPEKRARYDRGETENSMQNRAYQVLLQTFSAVAEKGFVGSIDVVRQVRFSLRQAIEACRAGQDQFSGRRKRLEEIRDRLVPSGDGPDIARWLLDQQIKMFSAEALASEKEALETALRLLEGYSYTYEARPTSLWAMSAAAASTF